MFFCNFFEFTSLVSPHFCGIYIGSTLIIRLWKKIMQIQKLQITAVLLAQWIEHLLSTTAVSWVWSPVLACGMAMATKSDWEAFSLPRLWYTPKVSSIDTDHLFLPKMEHTDGWPVQAVCTVWLIMPVMSSQHGRIHTRIHSGPENWIFVFFS